MLMYVSFTFFFAAVTLSDVLVQCHRLFRSQQRQSGRSECVGPNFFLRIWMFKIASTVSRPARKPYWFVLTDIIEQNLASTTPFVLFETVAKSFNSSIF